MSIATANAPAYAIKAERGRTRKMALFVVALAICAWLVQAALPQAAWAGETYSMSEVASGVAEPQAGDTVTISSGAELAQLASYVNGSGTMMSPNSHPMVDMVVELTGDIDLKDVCHPRTGSNRDFKEWGGSSYTEEVSWTPIGTSQNPFRADFRGNGYAVKNLYINATGTYKGLFAYAGLASGQTPANYIRDLTVEGYVHVTNSSMVYAAGVCAKANSGVRFVNVRNEATVIGNLSGTSVVTRVGGIVADASYGVTFVGCVNNGDVQASASQAGGILAVASATTTVSTFSNAFIDCQNTGSVTSLREDASGIAGILGYRMGKTRLYMDSCYTTSGSAVASAVSADNLTANNVYQQVSADEAGRPVYKRYLAEEDEADVVGHDALLALLNGNAASSGTWFAGDEGPVPGWLAGAPTVVEAYAADPIYADEADTTKLSIAANAPLGSLTGNGGTLSYRWQRNAENAGWQDVAGATGDELNVTSAMLSTGKPVLFRCVVSNAFDGKSVSVNSAVATVILRSSTQAALPSFKEGATKASMESVLKGQSVALQSAVETDGPGIGELAYQWYRCSDNQYNDPVALTNVTDAAGTVGSDGAFATSAYVNAPQVGPNYYFCTVTNTFEGNKVVSSNSPIVVVTVADSFTIADVEGFQAFRDRVNGLNDYAGNAYKFAGVTVRLESDIDLGGLNWIPIGASTTNSFQGVFDGQGHVISNLSCTSGTYRGLFGYLYGTAGVRPGVKNLTVKGSVTGTSHVGGLVAYAMYADFDNVVAAVDVTNTTSGTLAAYTAGIAAWANNSTFTDCASVGLSVSSASRGAATGTSATGGIVGYVQNTAISSCYNAAKISNSYSAATNYANVGGIAGSAAVTVSFANCFNVGELDTNVSNYGRCGGIVGYATTNASSALAYTMTSCYNRYDGGEEIGITGWTSQNGTNWRNVYAHDYTGAYKKSAGEGESSCADAAALLAALQSTDAEADAAWVAGADYPELAWASGAPAFSKDLDGVRRLVDAGDSVELSVAAVRPAIGHGSASGDTISYRWQSSSDNTEFADIEGQTGQTFTVSGGDLAVGECRWFRCVATNTGSDVIGGSAWAASTAVQVQRRTSKDAAVPVFVASISQTTVPIGALAFPEVLKVATEAASDETLVGEQSYQWYSCSNADKDDAKRLSNAGGPVAEDGSIASPDTSALTSEKGEFFLYVEVTNTAEGTKVAKAQSGAIAVKVVDEYTLTSASQLAYLAEQCNTANPAAVGTGADFRNVTFKLGNDIDLSQADGERWSADSKWMCIGNKYLLGTTRHVFSGTFDGDGHTISGFSAERMNPVDTYCYNSLFGIVSGATIKNLTVAGDANANAGFVYQTIADDDKRPTLIENCTNKIKLSASTSLVYAGGIIACATEHTGITVRNCSNEAEISSPMGQSSSSNMLGGIAGAVTSLDGYPAVVDACDNSATVSSTATNGLFCIGGIVGSASGYSPSATSKRITYATVSSCSNSGKVRALSSYGGNSYIGGVAGKIGIANGSKLLNTGDVVRGTVGYTGGIVGGVTGGGMNSSPATTSGSLSECVNVGDVLVGTVGNVNYNRIGGVAGTVHALQNFGGISKCANHGNVGGSAVSNVGGLVGYAAASADAPLQIADSYNSGAVAGSTYACGLIGRVNAIDQAKLANCYNVGPVSCPAATGDAIADRAVASTNTYYVDTSDPAASAAESGTAKTLAEMRASDFVATMNGTGGAAWVQSKDYYADGAPILAIELDSKGGIVPAPELHTVTVDATEGGTVTLDPAAGTKIARGATVTIAAAPARGKSVLGDPEAKYLSGDVEEQAPVERIDQTRFTFHVPGADATVAVRFGNELAAELKAAESTYDKTAKQLDLTVKAGDADLVAGTDYDLVVKNAAGSNVDAASGLVNAGTYSVSVDGKGSYGGHYDFTYTIQPKKLVVYGFAMQASKVYNSEATIGSVTVKNIGGYRQINDGTNAATYEGVIDGDVVYATAVKGAFEDGNVLEDAEGNALDKDITLDSFTLAGAAAANYVVDLEASQAKFVDEQGNNTLKAKITRRPTGATTSTAAKITGMQLFSGEKVYDGTTDFDDVDYENAVLPTGTAAGVNGVVPGDVVGIGHLKATLAGKDVAEGVALTFSDVELVGKDADNYSFIANNLPSYTVDIVEHPLTITPVEGQSKTYGAAEPELAVEYAGLVEGEQPAVSGSLSRAEGEDAGTYAISQGDLELKTNAESGFDLGNYKVSFTNEPAGFAVEPALLTVTPDAGQSFDADSPKLTYTVAGAQNGEEPAFEGALAIDYGDQVPAPGTAYPITLGNLALKDSGSFKAANYALGIAEGTVTAKATTVPASAVVPDLSKIYDGKPVEGACESSSGGEVTYTWYSGDAAEGEALNNAPVDAGTYAVKASVAATTGYQATEAVATFAIAKRPLTVKADDLTIDARTEPSYTAGYDGLAVDDSASVLDGKLVFACAYDKGANKNATYVISPSGLTSGNYDISYVDGTLTVKAVAASAGETVSSGGASFAIAADGSATVTGSNAAAVTIPAMVADSNGFTHPVTSVAAGAFKGKTGLKSVSIGANVTTVGNEAFSGCTALTKVTGGANITTIGKSAFAKCKKLASITLASKKLTSIGASAFANCPALKKVTVKSTALKVIGKNAFANDKKLTTVSIAKTKKLKTVTGAFKKAGKANGKKLTVKVAKAKKKAYKKLIAKKGGNKKLTVK